MTLGAQSHCPGVYLGEVVMYQAGREIRLPPGRRDTVSLSWAAFSLHTKTPLLMPLISLCPCQSMVSSCWGLMHSFLTKSIEILSLAKLQGHFSCTPKGKAGRDAPQKEAGFPSGEQSSLHCTNPDFRSDCVQFTCSRTGLG